MTATTPTVDLRAALTTATALAIVDEVGAAMPAERRSVASRAARLRRDELALLAQLMTERDGRPVDVDRLVLDDPISRELLLLATA